MIYSAESDVVSFIRNLVNSLLPYAKANEINLAFLTREKSREVRYQPFLLSQSIVQLICNLINYLPPNSKIEVRLVYFTENGDIRIEVENTGLTLIQIKEIIANSAYNFNSNPTDGGTLYFLVLQKELQPELQDNQLNPKLYTNDPPHFYREIKKRFTQNFTRTERMIASLEKKRPHEAAFMQKINTLIHVNLEDENFGTDDLCKAMFLCRTQLFRKMKSLINEAPANYIKKIRLQKAKELLETTELTISEAAYKSGFQTINHFTKVFKEEYGIPPSVYRHNGNYATNG